MTDVDRHMALKEARSSRLGKLLLIASVVAYGASLLLPAFEVLTNAPETTPGWLALIFGAFMVLIATEN